MLIKEIVDAAATLPPFVKLGIAPAFPFLHHAIGLVQEHAQIDICAQNVSNHDAGAYTGEVSAEMLASIGLKYCIVGHSERREYFGETNLVIREKVDLLLKNGVTPIVCFGENLTLRTNGSYLSYIIEQLEACLFHLTKEEVSKVIIAYEPIWAIGTGETASPEQAQEVHKSIRNHLFGKYGADVSEQISLLYGGSCKPNNAVSLFSQADIDGGLIGGAALNASDFIQIANSF